MFDLMTVTVTLPRQFAPVVESVADLARDVAERADARGLEGDAHQRILTISTALMGAAFQTRASLAVEDDIRQVECRHCGGEATRMATEAPRYAHTIDGRVDFTRVVYRCSDRRCQRERSLFDEEIGLSQREHYTAMARDVIAWSGASSTSYDRAARDIEKHHGWSVSEKQAQRITDEAGQRAREIQSNETREFGRPISKHTPLPARERPETQVIEMDGTCVMGRDGQGREVKCATTFGLDARVSGEGQRPVLLRRAYVATSQGMSRFGAMVWAMAVAWGVRSAKRLVVIGDGADWIWKYSADRLTFARADGSVRKPVEILDYYHACENLTKARNAIYRDVESRHAREWYTKWKTAIYEGRVNDLIDELDRRSRAGRSIDREEVMARGRYFRSHRERMDYPRYRAEGLPIGSGAIEGTCKSLVKGRMSCVGQRWSDEGIENMVALRTQLFNDRWEQLWPDNQINQAA